jgi:hypothetical protein
MSENIIVKCPSCSHEFSLSEGVLSSVRENLSRELQSDIAKREQKLVESRKSLEEETKKIKQQQDELNEKVQSMVDEQLSKKEADIRKKAEAAAVKKANEASESELKLLKEDLESKAAALKKAREAELELQREKRKLADEKNEMELKVERTLNEEREKISEKIRKDADEANRLKFAEKDKQLSDLKEQLQEAQRKAEQGSMQTQGDVLEVDFEQQLKQSFPMDAIEPVSTGVRGADVTQEVKSNTGRSCGRIIYETKRTKNWSNAWPGKLKSDMRDARADLAMIVTQALPEGIDRFGEVDGVWVADYASAIPLASALRATLHEVMLVKGHQQGAKEKQELLYDYLTGNDFRQRVQAVIEAFTSMRDDLEKEKRALTKYWSKREKQLGLVIDNMSGMVGDVQALSGGAVNGIPALEFDADADEETED